MHHSASTAHIWSQIRSAHTKGGCLVMGILNVTPDSFSDGRMYLDVEDALAQARRMIGEGADIIDIGGESTRPGAEAVDSEEELRRVLPVIEAVRMESAIPISIDTRKAHVAHEAIRSGANIVNDISAGLHDAGMLDVIRTFRTPYIMMHMQGSPETMQHNPVYDDTVAEIKSFFAERLEHCSSLGITDIIIDPGIGFGKRLGDNLAILRSLESFASFEAPVMIGVSRKSFIGTITGRPEDERLGGSIAAALYAAMKGAAIVRVHDVLPTKTALQVLEAFQHSEDRSDAV